MFNVLKKTKNLGNILYEDAARLSGVIFSSLADREVLSQLGKLTQSATTPYDKALDAEYLETKIGGGEHRLFDGGHDVFSAWDRAKEALIDDPFHQEVIGYVGALWKDVTTTQGLPFFSVSKENFDSWVEKASSWIPGVNRDDLYDLLSFDAMEIFSTALGAVGVVFALKKEDQEGLAEILGSMGIISILSANPVMGILVIGTTGYAYNKKNMEMDKKALVKSATITTVSVALFSILGLPFLLELIFIGVMTKIFRRQILDNEKFQNFIEEKIVNCPKEKIKEFYHQFMEGRLE